MAVEDPSRNLVSSERDKIDLRDIVRRTEFYLKTSIYWLQAVNITVDRNVGWWARRAALTDVFGKDATDEIATLLGSSTRYISKGLLKAYKKDKAWEVWSCTSNEVTWASVKELAYTEFNGGKRALWERALLCHSPEIKMRNTEVLVERMSYVASRVHARVQTISSHLSIPGAESSDSTDDRKLDKEQGSKVDLMEVEE
jgi:hypothetical protein